MHPSRSSMVLSTFVLLFVTQACHAQQQTTTTQKPQGTPLMCYVCQDCAKLPENAQPEACDASYFDQGTTLPATQTTPDPTTTMSTESEETTDPPTTTEIKTTETTTEPTTTSTSTTTTTTTSTTSSPTPPTPPTVGPPITTSPVPTPPTPNTVAFPADVFANANGTNGTVTVPTTLLVRQLRQAIDTSVTYHCYSVVKQVNGTKTTDRGCSKVTTDEAVCTQLAVLSPEAQLSNCNVCTMNKCNGSSALGLSLLALIIGVLASLCYRK